MNAVRNLLLLLPILLAACVSTRSPVGSETGDPLEPKIWNATWLTADGKTIQTEIINPENREVRLIVSGEPEPGNLTVRRLGPWTVASSPVRSKKDTFQFARIVVTENHFCIFHANRLVFEKLASEGLLKSMGPAAPKDDLEIEHLSAPEYGLLQELEKKPASGFRVSDLFSPDPALVGIRAKPAAK